MGGATFSNPLNLSANTGNSLHNQIVVSGSTVMVIWEDTTFGNGDILLSRSTDGGATFANPVNLSNSTAASFDPQIAISGSTVLVAWQDHPLGNADIFLVRSTNGGANFGSLVNLSANSGNSFTPKIAISGSTVLVTWHDSSPGNNDIFLARSTDGGATFASSVNLSHNGGDSVLPKIATSGSTVLVAWSDSTPGNYELVLARSSDGGATFVSLVNLSVGSFQSFSHDIVVSGSTVLVTWEDNQSFGGGSIGDIFLARSTNGGANFAGPVNLSSNAGNSIAPRIEIAGSTVLVTWENSNPVNNDIFLARSTDGGVNFASPVNLSANFGNSVTPRIVISGSTILVTWADDTPVNRDTFFGRLEFP